MNTVLNSTFIRHSLFILLLIELIAAVFSPLDLSVHFLNRCMTRNVVCPGCCVASTNDHCLFAGVNIFIFSCYILNQIEDSVPTFSKKII